MKLDQIVKNSSSIEIEEDLTLVANIFETIVNKTKMENQTFYEAKEVKNNFRIIVYLMTVTL